MTAFPGKVGRRTEPAAAAWSGSRSVCFTGIVPKGTFREKSAKWAAPMQGFSVSDRSIQLGSGRSFWTRFV